MLSVAEAQERILAKFSLLEPENLTIAQAVGRVVAQPIQAERDLPQFTNASMDGFAVLVEDVRSASLQHPAILKVVGDIPAGSISSLSLQPGEAIRIMTGAALPGNAQAVVPVENTDFHQRGPGGVPPDQIKVLQSHQAGENVRSVGQDVRAGEVVLQAGQKLRPQEVGFLSMLGIERAAFYSRPVVAIFSTGDELVLPGQPLPAGKIYDSNSSMMVSLVEQAGGQAVNLGIARDREPEVLDLFEQAVNHGAHLILSTAGVSVGAFDFVRTVAQRHGELDFWRVNMRPGKPLAFGNYREIPFFGLPGNPVSAFVGFEVFVRPALQKMAGLPVSRRSIRVQLSAAIESDGRESYLRAIVTPGEKPTACLTGHQGSGNLRSLVQANALLIVPLGVKSLPSGALVDAWLLDG